MIEIIVMPRTASAKTAHPRSLHLHEIGKDVTFEYIPETGHAFANEDNALGTHDPDATAKTWAHTVEWLHQKLG